MNSNNYFNFTYLNYSRKKSKRNIILIAILFVLLIAVVLIVVATSVNQETLFVDYGTKAMGEKMLDQEKSKVSVLIKKDEEEKARQAKLPKLTDVGKENMANIYHSEKKRAFLTFDDGPSNNTKTILDTLQKEGIKATFFMLGTSVENYPETTKRVYDEGHFIANHGYSHVYSEIYSSPEEVLNEYNMCNDAVKNALGEPEYNSHLFRFPGGLPGGKYADIKQEAKVLLEQNGILCVDWNALTGDAEKVNIVAEELMDELKYTTEGKNSVVILMHDAPAKELTAEILPQVIAYLREQGYEFKTFYDIIK